MGSPNIIENKKKIKQEKYLENKRKSITLEEFKTCKLCLEEKFIPLFPVDKFVNKSLGLLFKCRYENKFLLGDLQPHYSLKDEIKSHNAIGKGYNSVLLQLNNKEAWTHYLC